MTATRLDRSSIAKPWGQRMLPSWLGGIAAADRPIGEIHYAGGAGEGLPLLFKYLFTSERLSIQVHPGDEQARRLGFAGGKEEAWLVLAAAPGATIGLGLTRTVSAGELRAAALDGSIERLVAWRPARAGDVHYVPAGTVHALGPGLVVAEVQQAADVTLRLYDYGRPRDLHLDEAVRAAIPGPHRHAAAPRAAGPLRTVLIEGEKFVVERWRGADAAALLRGADPVWIAPLSGACRLDGEELRAGEVAIASGRTRFRMSGPCDLLIAYPGARARSFTLVAPVLHAPPPRRPRAAAAIRL